MTHLAGSNISCFLRLSPAFLFILYVSAQSLFINKPSFRWSCHHFSYCLPVPTLSPRLPLFSCPVYTHPSHLICCMCKARNQLALGFSLELFGSWVRVGQGRREWVASKDSLVSLHSGGNWELCLFSPTLLSSIYGPSNIDIFPTCFMQVQPFY